MKGFHDSTFNGLMAPTGTPAEIVERLRGEAASAVAVPELRERFREQGIELTASASPEEFAAFLRNEIDQFSKLAPQIGLASHSSSRRLDWRHCPKTAFA